MSYEYYAEARHLADMLKSEGLDDWAVQILNVLKEGVTATEILMMLRWNIGNFLAAQVGSEEVIAHAKHMYKKMDAALS